MYLVFIQLLQLNGRLYIPFDNNLQTCHHLAIYLGMVYVFLSSHDIQLAAQSLIIMVMANVRGKFSNERHQAHTNICRRHYHQLSRADQAIARWQTANNDVSESIKRQEEDVRCVQVTC